MLYVRGGAITGGGMQYVRGREWWAGVALVPPEFHLVRVVGHAGGGAVRPPPRTIEGVNEQHLLPSTHAHTALAYTAQTLHSPTWLAHTKLTQMCQINPKS